MYSFNKNISFTSLYCDMRGRCAHIYHNGQNKSTVYMISGEFVRYDNSSDNALYLNVSIYTRCIIIVACINMNSIIINTYGS